MEDDDSAWGNAADDFSVSVYNAKAPSFGRRPNHAFPVVARVNLNRPPPTNLVKGRKMAPSKAAFPSTSFDTAFTIAEEENDPFEASFTVLPLATETRKQPKSGKQAGQGKPKSAHPISLQHNHDITSASAADRFHSSFGDIQEHAWNDQFFGQGSGNDAVHKKSATRETRRERSGTREPRGRSAGRLPEDRKERRRGRSSEPLHDTKISTNRNRSRSNSESRSRSNSKSREPESSSKKGSTDSAHRERSRSRGPLDGSRRSGTSSRSRSKGPPEAATSSDGRRRARARSKDAAATRNDTRGKSPGALRRAGSPGRLREASSRVRSKSPTTMQEGQSKSPGQMARRTNATSHNNNTNTNTNTNASTRKERTTFAPPRRTKSLDLEWNMDWEEANFRNTNDVEEDDDKNHLHLPKRASRKNAIDDSSKRAPRKTVEDEKSSRSSRSNLETTLRELPGYSQRTRHDEKSTSARSNGGKTTTTNSSGSSHTGASSLEFTSTPKGKMSRRSSRKDHGLGTGDSEMGDHAPATRHSPGSLHRRGPLSYSSNNSVSSGDSDEGDAFDGTKERRRRERVRTARERLLEEEAKVMQLQEATRMLEEKRIVEEARLEELREEAKRLEQSLGRPETALQKKRPTPNVAKRYGAGVGDTSQVPPAFQTWSKNHQ